MCGFHVHYNGGCTSTSTVHNLVFIYLFIYWGLTPQQQPGSYQGGGMMMKSVFWWRKPEYPEETTDLRQVTDETFHTLSTLLKSVSIYSESALIKLRL